MSQAQVLAQAETADGLTTKLEELLHKYRLYSRGEFGEGDSLVGTYDSKEEAMEEMHSISYDLDPAWAFYIMQGDDVVFGQK